jgi:hypothetical protein
MSLSWTVNIDWADTGSYTNEGGLVSDMSWSRGRQNFIKTDGSGFEEMQIGKMYVTLFNQNNRFDPYNASSPIYPNVEPGHLAQVSVSIDGGSAIPVFAGIVDDIKYVDELHIKLVLADGMSMLDTNFSSAVLENINVATAIDAILDAVSYPFSYDLETDSDIIPVFWGEGNAKNEIEKLAQSSLGFFYIAGDGKPTFHDRHLSAVGAIKINGSDIGYDVAIKMPWETKKNKIVVQVHPVTKTTGATIWNLPEAIAVEAGGSVEIWAEYVNSSGDKIPAAAVTVDSFTANSAADGSGTNMSTDFTVTLTAFAKTGKLEIANAGAGTAYLTACVLKGTAILEQDPVQIKKETSATRKRLFDMDLVWQQNANVGIDLAAYLLKSLEDPSINPVIQIENDPDTQFGFELGDLIELTITDKYINALIFRIGGIDGAWTQRDGQRVIYSFYLELLPDVLNQYFVLDISKLDIGKLGY